MMKRRSIWKLSVTTTIEAEGAVVELFSHVFGSTASAYLDARTQRATVAVFCERRPPALEAKRKALCAGLQHIKFCGLDVGPARIRIHKLPNENWAESWKRHFKPIEIHDVLLIKPSWSKRRPHRCQAVVVLDPGLSFGTGHHPTTEFCLRELVRNRTKARSFLDIGTGSGILAIAAAKLGYSPVCAFDFDPEAVRVARANARANRVDSKVQISRADVTKLSRRLVRNYDLVCTNLISTLLVSERRTISSMVKGGGLLILAGILKTEFREVQTAYELLGLRLVASKTEKEWRSGSFRLARHFNSRNET